MQRCISAGLVVATLAVALNFGTTYQGQARHAPLGAPSPLGALPARCPANTVTATYPLMQLGSIGKRLGTLVVPADPRNYSSGVGWGVKRVWFVTHGFSSYVLLRGARLLGGPSLHFTSDGSSTQLLAKGTLLRLDAHKYLQVNSPRILDLDGFHSAIFVSQAGCYGLEAQWPGGKWRLIFAAGSSPAS